MGKQDIVIKNWLQNPVRFADLFNAAFFDGQSVVTPDDLSPCDRETDIVYKDKNRRSHTFIRHRDLAMLWKHTFELAIITLEIQSHIHYAMPVRCMMQDGMNYTEQLKNTWNEKKQNEKTSLSSDEFLSRFSRQDRLIPVLTIIFYYAKDRWDGPADLHSMFRFSNQPLISDVLKKYIPNYRLNLIDVNDFSKINLLKSDLLFSLNLVKLKKDKRSFYDYLIRYKNYFQHVDEETACALGALLHSERLAQRISSEINTAKSNHEKEDVNMCQALEELMEDSRLEGITIGKQEGITLGRQEGITEGSRHAAADIAKKMLREGLPCDLIARVTGLSNDQLKLLS